MQIVKTYVFPKQPYDYTLFVRGINMSGRVDSRRLTPANEVEISEFEKFLGFELPSGYRDFLSNCNGGVINPKRASRYVGADVVKPLAEKPFSDDPSIGIDFFFTLDKASLLDEEDENRRASRVYSFHLPSAQNIYSALADDELTKGLENEKLIYFADGHSFYWLLGCDGKFKNKVLVLNTNLDPETPLDNVAVIADSFDEFMQSLYFTS